MADIQALRPRETVLLTYQEKLNESLQSHTRVRTRILNDQTIVYTDIMRFVRFRQTHDLFAIEQFLLEHERIVREAIEGEGGVVRSIDGDNCLLTLPDTNRALRAISNLVKNWQIYIDSEAIDCPIKIAVTRGSLHVFRSFVIGTMSRSGATPVDIAKLMLGDLTNGYFTGDKPYVLVTNRIVEHADRQWTFLPIDSNEFFKGDDEVSKARKVMNKDLLQIPMYLFLP